MTNVTGRWCSAVLLLATLTACSDEEAAPLGEAGASASASAAPPPSEGLLLTSLLTPADIAPDVTGPPPAVAGTEAADVGVRDKPVCDVKADLDDLAAVSVGPMTDPDASEQVYEALTVADGTAEAQEYIGTVRERGEARCTFDETVAEATYTVAVEGPVELGSVGDEAAGYSTAYTGGYTGFRWDMTTRRGRILVNVQYTSTSPIEPGRAVELLRQALDKASVLA